MCSRCRPRRKKARPIATYPLTQIKRVRLVKRADGYYVQFAVKTDRQMAHAPTGKQTGIDVGLKAFYTDSDGQTVANPRYLRTAEKRLKRLHRRVSKKRKGSQNRKKAIKRLAKGYLKVQRQRKDFASKTARALVQSNDLVAYEDLQIASMVKNHHLAKSISDASWGLFLSWVRYYGTLAGVPVVAVSPRFTTQDCSGCGFRVKKTLSMRTHICPNCGLVLDRDENAALNILAAALVVAAALRTAGQVGTGSASPEHVASGQNAGTRCVRKSTSQTSWMNEESPGASFGECQYVYTLAWSPDGARIAAGVHWLPVNHTSTCGMHVMAPHFGSLMGIPVLPLSRLWSGHQIVPCSLLEMLWERSRSARAPMGRLSTNFPHPECGEHPSDRWLKA